MTKGTSISVALHNSVYGYDVLFKDINVMEVGKNNRHLSDVTKSTANNSTAHSGIKIELRGNSTANRIQIEMAKCKVAPGSAFSIEVTNQSRENVILFKDALLFGSNSSEVHSRGLQVIITGWARRNEIQANGIKLLGRRALCGAGGYVEFSEHARENIVTIQNSVFSENHALTGGGSAVICKDYAIQNTFWALLNYIKGNVAALAGGGVYLHLQDSSNNNTIHLTGLAFANNTAHCGGGMFIEIKDSAVASRVEIIGNNFIDNTLLPSERHDLMGGGVHVEFSTVSATFRTDNIVTFTKCWFAFNSAEQGVGGGISVLYKHSRYQDDSGDSVIVNYANLMQNKAASGSACAFQSLPTHGKRLFTGVKLAGIQIHSSAVWTRADFMQPVSRWNAENLLHLVMLMQKQQSETIIPSQVETNKSLIFAKSVLITLHFSHIFCGACSQGIYALDSEIALQTNSFANFEFCVATHGGAIALYGESYIRIGTNATMIFYTNHAFQRGGAIYASSAPGVVPVSNCFLQTDQDWKENRVAATFKFTANTAKFEGQSVYISDIQDCFTGSRAKNITIHLVGYSDSELSYTISFNVMQVNFLFSYVRKWPVRLGNDIHKHALELYLSQLASQDYGLNAVHREIMSGPNHVSSVPVDLRKPTNLHFIPGKQKRLPYTHAYDEFGNTVSSVFTVLINKMDDSLPVQVNSFSKYTADFIVILHGIPQQHGMANHYYPHSRSNTSAVARPSQLVLQSFDSTDLLLVMNIELQCCPPGYIFQYGSGDMGTCQCGMLKMIGIAKCNESHPEKSGAVLDRDHWAGYLPSNDQHSCEGQKFFTGQCPPGYCQSHQITLPDNNSNQELKEVMCTGSNRKEILCGDCLEGNGVAVNFNGVRPVCVDCTEGLNKVGILVWILSEWVPMLAFMFVLMLFNIDLVSGRFNSFLLFAQLLAFSTIRGDAELGAVHNAFVRIYRFLYGMWNLDFFGVLLPPYCLTPHAHLTLLQTILLHYSIGLFPLTVAITLVVLERSAEKWICCHRVDQCLRRMRRWKAKYSDGMSYDRALPAFVILGFTRFLVSSTYILVNQTITGEDGERKVVVWWQGSVPYGSIQHIAYFIPAIVILLMFVLLPSFLLLTLPIGPQLFGRLIIAVPPLRKLQRMQTFCSNVYTDRWVYHFVNVFQGCYKELFRSFSSLYLFHRIVHLLVAVFISRAEDALRIQIFLIVALLLLISTLQPYNSSKLNTLDAAILGNLALILILSLHITDLSTSIGTRQFFASLQMILIYLPLLYPGILLGRKVYLKCRQLRCCQKQEEPSEDNAEPLLEGPAERLGNLVLITELRAGVPTSEDDDTVTETETHSY